MAALAPYGHGTALPVISGWLTVNIHLTAVGGLDSLRAWLRAELFMTNYRPVPLSEHVVFGVSRCRQ